jgi:hypothetical protein
VSDFFKISVLDLQSATIVIDGFKTAYRANARVDALNCDRHRYNAEYIGDSRDRIFIKKAARVRVVQAELLREHKLLAAEKPSTKHWPGPWTFEGPHDHGMHILADSGGMEITIARDVTIENAPLIAAAPELAEALKDVVRWLDNTGTLHDTDKLVPHLRTALVKAGVT